MGTDHINREAQAEGVIHHQCYCVSEGLAYILKSLQSSEIKMQSSLPPPLAPLPPKAIKRGYNDLSRANQPAAKYPKADESMNINEMQGIDVAGNRDYEQQHQQEQSTVHQMDPVMYAIQGERYIFVGTFKNNVYIKIRDYTVSRYTNKLQYTKKDMNPTLAQWQLVKALMPYIDEGIQKMVTPDV